MVLPPRWGVLLYEGALACLAVGLFSFAMTDAVSAYASSLNLEAARGAVESHGWRVVVGGPDLPVHRAFDAAGFAGFILLVALALVRAVPAEHRARVHAALGLLAVGFAVSLARPFLDRTHDHANEGAWGALQLGFVSATIVCLAWRSPLARLVALVGGAFLTARQPAIWHASDAFVRATGDFTLAYGAELWTVVAHAIGAIGAGLLALALVLALFAKPRAQARERIIRGSPADADGLSAPRDQTTSASGSTRASLYGPIHESHSAHHSNVPHVTRSRWSPSTAFVSWYTLSKGRSAIMGSAAKASAGAVRTYATTRPPSTRGVADASLASTMRPSSMR